VEGQMKKLDTYKLALYPIVLSILIIWSVFQVGLDMTKILTDKFWLELFLKYLIQVAWIYFGVPDGKDIGSVKADYVQAKKALNKSITLIKDKGLMTLFSDYVKSHYVKQRKEYVDDVLFANGITKELFALPLKEIKKQLSANDLTIFHYHLIKKLKRGEFYFPFVSPQTYLSAYDVRNHTQMALYNEKNVILRSLFPKMILTFTTLALSSSAVITETISLEQALFDSAFNVGLSIMSYGFAFKLGLSIMMDYAKLFDYRKNYISHFIENYDNGKYVPDLAVYTIEKVEQVV
jgi:hypothetical protein